MLMDDKLKLTEEKKAQLLKRVKDALDDDVLDLTDWMKIYDVLLEACERESAKIYEDMLTSSVEGGIQ